MRTEHARSQPKTPCMSRASLTRRAINHSPPPLNCRFHMNEQEVAKIRDHRMDGSTRNILWLASSVLHKWEHMNALGEVHSEAPDCLYPGGRRAHV